MNTFLDLLKQIPKRIRNFNRISMGVAAQMDDIIAERFNSQKEFAKFMDQEESVITRWLSGKHNFTIKTIAEIEEKLDVNLIYSSYELNKLGFYNLNEAVNNCLYFNGDLKTTTQLNALKNDCFPKSEPKFINFTGIAA